MLRVGVRYCGGCNPGFERVALVEHLFGSLEGKAQAVGYREEAIQALLVVCGCATACPAQEGVSEGLPRFVLREEKHLQEAAQWLKGLLGDQAEPNGSEKPLA